MSPGPAIAPHYGEIGFGLIIVGNPDGILLAHVPAGRKVRLEPFPQLIGCDDVARLLGHLPHQDPCQEFDRGTFVQHTQFNHPVILIDREAVYVRGLRQLQRRLCLHHRGHQDRS